MKIRWIVVRFRLFLSRLAWPYKDWYPATFEVGQGCDTLTLTMLKVEYPEEWKTPVDLHPGDSVRVSIVVHYNNGKKARCFLVPEQGRPVVLLPDREEPRKRKKVTIPVTIEI